MKIFIGGVPLDKIGVTQNEYGWYYWNGSSYYKPTLSGFDNAKLPAGYKKYTDGSHSKYLSQKAVDLTAIANRAITFDTSVTVLSSSSSLGSYCKVRTPEGNVFLVHTDRWKSGGVPAFEPVCYIKDMAGSHLHIYLEGGWIRDIILDTQHMEKGDRVEWTRDTNIRQGNGTSYPVNTTAKQGAVATLRSLEVRKADGYDWMDVEHPGVTGWAVTKNMVKTDKEMTNSDGSLIAPPKTCDERIKEAVDSTTHTWSLRLSEEQEAHKKTQLALVEVNDQKKALEAQLARVEQDYTLCQERNEKLESDLKDLTKLLKEASDRILSLEARNRKLEADNAKLKADLEECQGGVTPGCLAALAQLANKLLEWLNGNKLSLGLQKGGDKGEKDLKSDNVPA